MAMLEVKDLQVYYGVIQALKGISFHVNQGEVIALIGANGAGKTTTLQTLTGILSPKSGSIVFEGKDLTRTPAHKIVEMGMAHVPEGRRVFADMSVYENLLLGAYTRKDKAEIAESLASVYKRFPRLEERKGQRAGTLSGGEQQMLAMGRALMSRPRIILMDEPSMGLSPIFVNEIFDIIREVSESGTTVLLVEQNAKKALSIADRAYVLETGSITMDGKAEDLLNDEAVQKAYLGEYGGKTWINFVITIARQYGSGGHEIGQKLAKELGIKCYDKELLDRAAKESGICQELFEHHDERPTNSFLYSLVMDTYSMNGAASGYTEMPLNYKVFLAQFNAIKQIAKEGPCVMIGRCADYALADFDNCISILCMPIWINVSSV